MGSNAKQVNDKIVDLLDDDLVDETEASHLLGKIGINTLRNWRVQKCGPPFFRIGAGRRRLVRYRVGDLRTHLASCRIETKALST
ncbi:MAG: hypothetical protein QM741_00810 [Rudaea sp.]|uniref:hypothetical protein n=1 Tax=Rudaea sp. TaxID=2136325 RepID=UPI0039E7082E